MSDYVIVNASSTAGGSPEQNVIGELTHIMPYTMKIDWKLELTHLTSKPFSNDYRFIESEPFYLKVLSNNYVHSGHLKLQENQNNQGVVRIFLFLYTYT